MNADDERRVELVAEGAPAALDELERLLRSGPDGARVESVEAQAQRGERRVRPLRDRSGVSGRAIGCGALGAAAFVAIGLFAVLRAGAPAECPDLLPYEPASYEPVGAPTDTPVLEGIEEPLVEAGRAAFGLASWPVWVELGTAPHGKRRAAAPAHRARLRGWHVPGISARDRMTRRPIHAPRQSRRPAASPAPGSALDDDSDRLEPEALADALRGLGLDVSVRRAGAGRRCRGDRATPPTTGATSSSRVATGRSRWWRLRCVGHADATLGILATGSYNNMARGYGIPVSSTPRWR